MYCIFETFMTSICEKEISGKVRLIHVEEISLYQFHRFKKKTIDTAEDQISQARQFKSMEIYGFSKNDLYPHNHKCQFDVKRGSLSMHVTPKISY